MSSINEDKAKSIEFPPNDREPTNPYTYSPTGYTPVEVEVIMECPACGYKKASWNYHSNNMLPVTTLGDPVEFYTLADPEFAWPCNTGLDPVIKGEHLCLECSRCSKRWSIKTGKYGG